MTPSTLRATRRPSPTAAARLLRRTAAAWRCRRGIAAMEFGVLAPTLFLIVLGGVKFGLAVNHYMILTSAAEQGAQVLALMRGQPPASNYSTAYSAVTAAAAALGGTVTVSMTVGGTACTSSNCVVGTAGQSVVVALSYPCDLTVMGTNFGGSNCILSAQSAAVVQ